MIAEALNLTLKKLLENTLFFPGLVTIGLVFAVVGAFVLGPWAFYRTLRGHGVDIADGAAIWWGFGIVAVSLAITAAGFFGFLMLVGAY